MQLKVFKQKVAGNKKSINSLFKKLKHLKSVDLDHYFNDADELVFENMDCLDCANCCKTTGPLFTSDDVERIAKFLKVSPGSFAERYLETDEENDLVLKSVPCPFLAKDNRCTIYEVRPKACAEYPRTHKRNVSEILDVLKKDVSVCPAVFEMLCEIDKQLHE